MDPSCGTLADHLGPVPHVGHMGVVKHDPLLKKQQQQQGNEVWVRKHG